MSDFRPLLAPQQLCANASLPMDTDSRASAPTSPARAPEARADWITAIPQNFTHKKEQIEPKLSDPTSEFMSSVHSSAPEYHQTGSHSLYPLMPTRGRNTEICPVRKRTSWDSGLCRPTTVSERPPKRLVLALLGASTAGAVLMAQWRLGDTHKQPDHPRSRTAQQGFLSHPGVLILGISLHVAALTLVYHLNGFDRRQDVFLIVTTGATATVASLLGLEVSTILLRVTPWASIVALCASTYRKSG